MSKMSKEVFKLILSKGITTDDLIPLLKELDCPNTYGLKDFTECMKNCDYIKCWKKSLEELWRE